MTIDDVIVTAILLALCLVVIAVIGAICRMLRNYRPKATSSAPFARCRFEYREYAAVETTRPQSSQEPKARRDSHPTAPTKTASDPRSVFGSPPSQDDVQPGDGWTSKGREGLVDHLGNYYSTDTRELYLDGRCSDRNGESAGHDVVEAVEGEALAPPTAAYALATSCGDDVILQSIIVAGVASSSTDVQGVTGVMTSGLQRALSCDSVMSDTSAADVDVILMEANKIGQLEFGLHYDSELSDLVVNVIQAKDLERNPVTGSQDSYVKLWLAPHNDDRKYQTKTQKNSVNPEYSERFRFRVVPDKLDDSCVQFQVYSCDRYARQKLLGETEVRLGDVDLRQPVRVWMNLHDMDQRPISFGDIMFSMAYLPTAERLTVVIAKARNLQSGPLAKLSADCFAKVHILQKGKKVAKKKTSKKHDSRNPIFNEAMTFSVPTSSLLSVQLRISVYVIPSDRGGGGGGVGMGGGVDVVIDDEANEIYPVGHVTLGPKSGGMELVHWTQTMTSLRKPVTMWHSLRRD